ncbi:MAG: hypothetical protein E7183_07730 [Erysipelotrichaceae bacterium]|nr:hypothetical protein [Erysipelotrichaceae bacterium]
MIEFIKENIKTLKDLMENAKNNKYNLSYESYEKDLKKYEDLLTIVEAFEELNEVIIFDSEDYGNLIINFKDLNSFDKILKAVNLYIPF